MSEISEDDAMSTLRQLYSKNRGTRNLLLRIAKDALSPSDAAHVVEDNVCDVQERKRLFSLYGQICDQIGFLPNHSSLALFMLAPLDRLREQVESPGVDFKGLVLDCNIIVKEVVYTFLAKGGATGTPTPSAPTTPKIARAAQPGPVAPCSSSPTTPSPLTKASMVVGSDNVSVPLPAKRHVDEDADSGPKTTKRTKVEEETKMAKMAAIDTENLPKTLPPPSSLFPHHRPTSSSTLAPRPDSPNTLSRRKRDATVSTYHRDKQVCILSGISYPDGAYIMPFSGSKDEVSHRRLFNILETFWGLEATTVWRAQCEDSGITESPKNLLSLGKHLHAMWSASRFGLKPLRDPRAAERNEVWLQLHWLRQGRYKPDDPVTPEMMDELVEELSACRMGDGEENDHGFATSHSDNDGYERGRNGTLAHRESGLAIQTGEVFVVKADDPRELPSLDLLELQWHLVRLAAMSGAENVFSDDNDSEDDFGDIEAFQVDDEIDEGADAESGYHF